MICAETAGNSVMGDATACAAETSQTSQSACEAVETVANDDGDAKACTYSAPSTSGIYWSSTEFVNTNGQQADQDTLRTQLASATDILLQYELVDVYVRGSTTGEVKSCAHVLANDREAQSGTYTLRPDGMDPFDVYCDMSITDDVAAGGWTLVTTRTSGQPTQLLTSGSLTPQNRAKAVTAAQWTYLLDEAVEIAVVFSTALGRLTELILMPHVIEWGVNDAVSADRILDGGQNMYGGEGGNKLSTSLCSPGHLPYGDSFKEIPSTCFGATGKYYVDKTPHKMVLYAINSHSEAISFSVAGSLGARSGVKQTYQFSSTVGSTEYTGFITSVCDAGSATVNHVFVVDATLSSSAAHTANSAIDSDEDTVTGIGAGSAFFYMLYSSRDGLCMGSDAHKALFVETAAELDRLVEAGIAPVAPTFEIAGVCTNCEFAESYYIVVPKSKLARFGSGRNR